MYQDQFCSCHYIKNINWCHPLIIRYIHKIFFYTQCKVKSWLFDCPSIYIYQYHLTLTIIQLSSIMHNYSLEMTGVRYRWNNTILWETNSWLIYEHNFENSQTVEWHEQIGSTAVEVKIYFSSTNESKKVALQVTFRSKKTDQE